MKTLLIALMSSCLWLGSQSASAGLILEVNTTDKTFALTGSDSGAPFPASFGGTPFGFMFWENTSVSGGPSDFGSITFDNDVTWSTSSGLPGAGGLDTEIGSSGSIFLILRSSSASPQTITGSGVFQSYAALGPGAIGVFESLIGEELAPNPFVTTGFSNVPIQAASTSAVPEPASWLLMVIGVVGLGARRRWQTENRQQRLGQ